MKKSSFNMVSLSDTGYPPLLRMIKDPPETLYYAGNLALASRTCISVVGSRHGTAYGRWVARLLGSKTAQYGISLVSGLAAGIDAAGHQSALDHQGPTIAVLGTGIDICYPRSNQHLMAEIEEKGLILTEYPPGFRATPYSFPARNRIISGLSLGVVVVEAALRSGSLITARLALEQNRAVYAVPGGIGSKYAEGCQKLIRDGAQPIFSFSDILSDLSAQLKTLLPQPDSAPRPYSLDVPQEPFQSAPAAPPPLRQPDRSTLEGRILTLLAQSPRAIDDVCQSLGCDPGEAGSTLIILEVRGLIRQRPDLRSALT